MKTFVHTWDWKSQPDWSAIEYDVRTISPNIFLKKVETNSDELAVVVSNIEITQEQANAIYLNHDKN